MGSNERVELRAHIGDPEVAARILAWMYKHGGAVNQLQLNNPHLLFPELDDFTYQKIRAQLHPNPQPEDRISLAIDGLRNNGLIEPGEVARNFVRSWTLTEKREKYIEECLREKQSPKR